MNATATDWNSLPDIVLTNAFKHLKGRDRFNASLVNRTWSRAFRSPELWRKMNVQQFDEKELKFVQSFGQYLYEMEIEFLASRKSLSNENVLRFFSILIQKNPIINQLKKFTFKDLGYISLREGDLRLKMLGIICDFLGTQRNIIHFDMKDCGASLELGLDLLSQLKNSSRTLRILKLQDFFTPGCKVPSLSPNIYFDVIGSFLSLVHLKINYECIDSKVLRLIVGNCNHSLEIIDILCKFKNGINPVVIPNETWTWVRKICPKLKVNLDISCFSENSDLCQIIPSEMGLNSFSCWFYHSQNRFDSLMIQLCQFRETLETIKLCFPFEGNFDDKHLIELVSSCRLLKTFDFTGFCSIETVKKISEMQLNGTIHLNECKFCITSDEIFDFNEEDQQVQQLNASIERQQKAKFYLHICYNSVLC